MVGVWLQGPTSIGTFKWAYEKNKYINLTNVNIPDSTPLTLRLYLITISILVFEDVILVLVN